MIKKYQWVILPSSIVQDSPGLYVSPPGVPPKEIIVPVGYVTTRDHW